VTPVIIHVGGHLAVGATGQVAGGDDTARQAEHIYGVIERIVAAAGAKIDDVFKTVAYLTDVATTPQ
jgi:enamine deaminase RidA (YjgF/YER057c/UK114 family)